MSSTNDNAYPIPHGPLPGQKIVIYGKPTCVANDFSVNIVLGPNYDSDAIVFHFDVRFNGNYVVCNSREALVWGNEEVHRSRFPFDKDVPFTMKILICHYGYEVSVNGYFFSSFNHRIQPGASNNFLIIRKHVFVCDVQFC